MRELLVRAARGERTRRPPVWLMRQAGRYLPEYREVRSEYSFLEAIKTPEVAARISLQPWERFQPDGVVMYSDILVVLEPLGLEYHIEPGVGPVVARPATGPADLDTPGDPATELGYVGDLIERLSSRLGDRAAVIGFAGGPFTLASYAVEGEPTRTHMALRRLRADRPAAFRSLLERFADIVREFLAYQVACGADVVQLFDTYAGVLTPADYREFLLPLHRTILTDVDVPSIVFVRNMGGRLDLLAEAGADVVGHDPLVSKEAARGALGVENLPLEEAVEGAAALAVVSVHEPFRSLDWAALAKRMVEPRVVVDGRNLLDDEVAERAGLTRFAVGVGRGRR